MDPEDVAAIEPVTALKTRSAQIIRRARESTQPIVITQNGRATAVVQDYASFLRQRNALLLLKLLGQGEAELEAGRGLASREVDRRVRKRLRALKRG